jgi:uncharacterized delta-60 repeat protein
MVRIRHLLLLWVVLVVAAPLFALPAHAAANAGELDPSFGEGGVATLNWPKNFALDFAIDHQGRIVIAGIHATGGADPLIGRFNPDGSADESFGYSGVRDPPWCNNVYGYQSGGYVYGVAIDGADRIILVGTTAGLPDYPPDVCVVRLLANGDPDPSFSEDGMMTVTTAGKATDVATDHEGRILVAGSDGLTAVRIADSGTLDPTFGEGGVASLHLGQESEARAIAADSSGRVIVAGTETTAGGSRVAIARFGTGGRPDPSFAGIGYETLGPSGPPGRNVATGVVLDQFGRLVLSGGEDSEGSETALAGRLLPNGALDPSFGEGGRARLPISTTIANGIAVDQAGRVLVTGNAPGGYMNFGQSFLVRLGSDGLADGSFGDGGVVRPKFGMTSAVEVDSAGRYLVANSLYYFAVARYLPGTPVSPPTRYHCGGRRATIVGTRGRDVLKGTKRGDVIVGLRGNDVIRGFGGNDVICGDAGRDRLFGGKGRDKLFGGKDADLLVGGPGRDRLHGGLGRDVQR